MALKINGTTVVDDNRIATFLGLATTSNPTTLVAGSSQPALTVTQTDVGPALVINTRLNDPNPFQITNAGKVSVRGSATGNYDLEVFGTGYYQSNLTVDGNLVVNGDFLTVNTKTLVVDDKNIELGAVTGVSNIAGNLTSTSTTTTITGIASTAGMVVGQALTKVSGAGVFGGATRIVSIDSSSQITISTATANTAGTIVFNVGGASELTAEGGGLTLKGATDKYFNWLGATNKWTTNVGLDIATDIVFGGSLTGTSTSVVNFGSGQFYKGSDGKIGVGTFSPTVKFTVVGTDAIKIPAGATNDRPVGEQALLRFNTTTKKYEGHDGTSWVSVGGGATGTGSDAVFMENDTTVTQSYTITAGKNAGTFGPVTINTGISVTVPNGSVWTVV